jgi:diguanylate cyclase (GGDEF)-like protein
MTGRHELTLFGIAALICIFGAYATSVMGRQAYVSRDAGQRARWMVFAAFAATCAIWADSFIAILLSRGAVPAGFAALPMAASFVVTFGLVAVAAWIALTGRSFAVQMLGGFVIGLAISSAFYVGARALEVRGTATWDDGRVAASVAVGIGFSLLSLGIWLRSRSLNPMLAIALFAAAICGDHLLAMSAVTMTFDPAARLPQSLIDDDGLELIVAPIAIVVMVCTLVAQSMNRKSRRRSEAERRQLQQLAEIAVEGLAICEGSRIVWINRSLAGMLAGGRESRIGGSIETLIAVKSLAEVPHGREHDTHLRTLMGSDEGLVPVRVIVRPIVMRERPHVVVAIRDQRERLRAEAEMQRLASSDALTGLANRGRFNAFLEERFASIGTGPSGTASTFALLSLDLDRFKSVNDTHGHAAGDAVLMEVGARLCALVREGDLVARLGGDEFAILASIDGDPQTIGALAGRAIESISQTYVIDGRSHHIGVSIGVAFAMKDGADSEALKRCADLALYRAKAEGRGMHCVFEIGMRLRMDERHGLEQDLRQAIEDGDFVVHYQPQVDARTGAYNGAEALVRWMHPVRGLVLPSDFIPLAEETCLIGAIGEWVLRTACAEAAGWPDHLTVAVNLSPIQFRDPALVSIVTSALAWADLPGHRLELEITESVLIEDTERVAAVLNELKALGIRLSLDDFGTGYSSLGHLHRFPFDKIKVDRSFVQGIPKDQTGVAIIRTVVALAAGLGLQTTAEGVETDAQRVFVVEEGCDQIQGFLFGHPVLPEALPRAFSPPLPTALQDTRPLTPYGTPVPA